MSTAVFSNTNTTNPLSSRSMSSPHSVSGSGVIRSNNNSNLSPQPRVLPGHASPVVGPHPNDVLSGRGGRINSHPGNVRFRALIEASKRQYLDARTKKVEKARIAADIVDAVRRLDPPGKFLREDPHTGTWAEIGDERACKKAGQALRESAPEIRAERQARLLRRAGAADVAAGAATTRGGGGGGRRSVPADPPGPRHRPNPPSREGLAAPRGSRCDDRGGRRQEQPQPSAGPEDLELAQMRREYLQMQRLQAEQQRRMLQYQEQLLAAQQLQLQNKARDNEEDPVYEEYQRMVQAQLTSQAGGQGERTTQPQQQCQQQPQRYQNQEHIVEAFDILASQGNSGNDNQPGPVNVNHIDQYSHNAIQAAEGFNGQRFHSCGDDKTINTISSFDVRSAMDLSSLGGFNFNQSQMSALTSGNYNASGLMSASSQRTRGSGRGGARNGGARKPVPERQPGKANAAHGKREERSREAPPETLRKGDSVTAAAAGGADRPRQPHPSSRRPSAASHGVHMMSSLHSFGFDAIEEDELRRNLESSNFMLSNLGMSNLSAMEMTFGESMNGILSVRSDPNLAEKDGFKENGGTRASARQRRGKAIGNGLAGAEKRLTAQNLANGAAEACSEASSEESPCAAPHNLSTEDFADFAVAATAGGADRPRQPCPSSRRPSAASHGVRRMSSLGFDAIEEDVLHGNLESSNFELSNLGMSHLSAMEMTFGESLNEILSVRSDPNLADKDAVKENGGARASARQRRGKAIGNSLAGAEKRLTAQNLAGAAKASSEESPSAAPPHLSMEGFGESFKSMDMEDHGVPPSRLRPRRRSTLESLGISDRALHDLGASLESLRSCGGGSGWSDRYNSIETFGSGSGGGCGEEEEHWTSGDMSASRMVMAAGGR